MEECTSRFQDLCKQAFTRRTGSNIPGIGWFVENHHHSRYKTRPLEEALIDSYSEDEHLFGGFRPHASYGTNIKVAVTSTSASGSPVILANYNRLCGEKLPYQFQRPERLASELKIWEAARATSAAPRMFKPFCHGPSKQVYTDGAIYHNNPIQIADKERKLIWPELENDPPDIIVSVGTSYNPAARSSAEKALSPLSPRLGVFSHGKSLMKIAIDHIASSLDSEKTWHSYMNVLHPPTNQKARYVRINPQLRENPPGLDEVERLPYIQEVVREMSSTDVSIQNVALRLIASSFYFEKSHAVELASDGSVGIKGHISCRLLEDSKEISELGKLMRNKLHSGHELSFVIQEEHQGQHAKQASISIDVIERMIRKRQFKMNTVSVQLSTKLAYTEILLHMGPGDVYPISRFPRSLLQDEDSKERTRQNAAMNSHRWAGRTPSQRTHRRKWIPPHLPERGSDSDRIMHYSRQDYVIGESSQGMLQMIAHRLNNGPSAAQVVPELDTSDLESEMAELSRRRSEPAELYGDSLPVELDAGPAIYPTQQANRFQSEAVSSRLSGERTGGHLSGPFNEPHDLQEDTEHASPSAARQVRTGGRKWEGGFF